MRKMPEKPASMTGPTIERTISFERPRVSSRVWPSRGGGPAVMTTMSASPRGVSAGRHPDVAAEIVDAVPQVHHLPVGALGVAVDEQDFVAEPLRQKAERGGGADEPAPINATLLYAVSWDHLERIISP